MQAPQSVGGGRERIVASCRVAFAIGVVLFSLAAREAVAQTPPITSSGLNTVVTTNGTVHDITGGTRVGTNLFHSFGEFNVPTANIANFQNTQVNGVFPATSNILSRVTGPNGNNPSPSNIFGTIQTTNFGSANLFLMNPAGIVFGPNATLNVGGSVHFTTADYLKLADGAVFNAVPNLAADSLLTTAPVAAFGFLGSNPAAITVQGSQLAVAEGKAISLVGGDITIGGSLKAPGGTIALASVASPGEALMTNSGTVELFDAAGQPLLAALGNIVIAPGSLVDVSGNAAGTIAIRGGKLTMTDSQVLAVTHDANAAPVGIDIHVSGDANFLGGQLGQSYVMTWSEGSGNAGDVIIQSKNYLQKGDMTRPIRVGSTTFGAGDGGDVTIKASESITVEGSYTELGSGVEGGGTGKGGDVLIEAPLVNVQGGGIFDRAPGDGPGGTLTIKADDVLVTIRLDIDLFSVGRVDTRTYGPGAGGDLNSVRVTDTGLVLAETLGTDPNAGKGGNIIITAPRIEVLSGWIDASTYGRGQGGSVTLKASEAITLDFYGTVLSQSISTDPLAGAGGHVTLEAPMINVSRGSRVGADSAGPGHAGDVTLIGTEQVNISGIGTAHIYSGDSSYPIFEYGSRFVIDGTTSKTWPFGFELPQDTTVTIEQRPARIHTFSQGLGSGGNITIRTPQLLLSDQAFITAENTGDGAAGHVLFQVGTLTTSTGASISTATAGAGAAGSIVIQGLGGPGTLPTDVTMVDSSLSTSALGSGAGGNILIGAGGSTPLTLTNTTISASVHDTPAGAASDQGLANIALAGPTIHITGGRLIAGTTGTRQGGDILIKADSLVISGGATITASSTGSGNAGNISINAGQQLTMQDSSITTEAAQGNGGNIDIQAIEQVQLDNSTISTSVTDGSGNGGNITIDPVVISLQNNSSILTQAVLGNGGNIILNTNLLLVDPSSVISASSEFGQSGTIQSPTSNLAGTVGSLSSSLNKQQALQAQRCAVVAKDGTSSFVIAGREMLPTEPGGWLTSPYAALRAGEGLRARGKGDENEDLGQEATGDGVDHEGERLRARGEREEDEDQALVARGKVEAMPTLATEDGFTVSLRHLTPAGFLTQRFADGHGTGCRA